MKNRALGQWLFTLAMYFLGACLLAGALMPALILFQWLWGMWNPGSLSGKSLFFGTAFGFGFFLSGITLVLETVVLRFLLGLKLREGEYGFFSAQGVKWAFVNAMLLIVNLTFMDFMRLTPLLPLYYRWMGAAIGSGVQINTKGIADVSLIEIGNDTVIGGDAVLIGHLAEHGKLKLKKTVIGKKVTVGLGAVILPGARIGDGAMIAARSVLSKGTEVPARSIFAGTPAKFIRNLDDRS